MLSLDKQEHYRNIYKQINHNWRSSVEIFAELAHQHIKCARAFYKDTINVLDLGCGAGGIMESIYDTKVVKIGVDIDLSSLNRHRDGGFQLICANACALPFDSHSFDLVVSSWMLEHLSSPLSVFLEISRVLKKDGHFLFLTPNRYNFVTFINRSIPNHSQGWLVKHIYNREEEDTFRVKYQANSTETLKKLAQSSQMEVIDLHLIDDPTYIAFNDVLFRFSVFMEKFIRRENKIHIVGDFRKI